MKALSVREPWASAIAHGEKTIEIRSRRTHAIGARITICSTATRAGPGLALCEVEIVACRPATDADAGAACVDAVPPGSWAWEVLLLRRLDPYPVRGRLGFWTITPSPPR